MITETIQSILFASYCLILWIAFAHFGTCLVLSFCCPLNRQKGERKLPIETSEPLVPRELQGERLAPVSPGFQTEKAPENSSPQPSDDISGKNIRELKALASERKIRGYGKLSKAELIAVLSR